MRWVTKLALSIPALEYMNTMTRAVSCCYFYRTDYFVVTHTYLGFLVRFPLFLIIRYDGVSESIPGWYKKFKSHSIILLVTILRGSSNQSAAPLECFNGHKNWLSGWFDDRKVSVDPIGSGAWVGNLVAFVDYPSIDQIPNGVTVINAGYLYIQLNSAKKYNYQVAGYGNQVTVVENNATAPWSNILVGLSAGKGYVYANYSGTGIGLVVQVCNIAFGSVDYAKVSLYLKDGVQTSQCSSPVNPVPSITPLSTPPPSFQLLPTMPTPLPSPSPTSKPTLMPASSPTRQPFAPLFTSPPTPLPTPPPSHAITRSPTMTPTRLLTPPSEPPFSSNTSPLVSISSSPALPTRRPTRQPHARVRLPTKPRTRRRPPTTPPTAS